MKVVILCGGLGTRLREETEYKPKALVTIGGKPILWHILKHYSHFGFKEFILCLGYRGDLIRDYFLNYSQHNDDVTVDLAKNQWKTMGREPAPEWKVTLAETGDSSMTGGRLRRVQKYVGEEPFMLTYGDAVCGVNLQDLLKFHKKQGRLATVTGVPPLPRFGELDIDVDRVVGFNEKPARQHGIINGGYFVFDPKVFSYLENDQTVLERSPLERLAKESQLGIFRCDGFWHCVDTFRDYKHLNEMWDAGDRPWVVWER